ncbi:MAG: hypothetical protein WAM60_01040 [Candidatus Promineifilaceae bacterium]
MVKVPNLAPKDRVEGRDFADPEQIPSDVNTLRYMTDQVDLFLRNPQLYEHLSRPLVVYRPDTVKWVYRMIIPEPEQLMELEEITFVGFLGQRREDADLALGNEFDEILVGEIPEHPGLLCYSTMALMCGNFCNLVLFTDETVKANWSRSKAHAQAVGRLAPEYYLSVRLYNGLLPKGVAGSQEMQMTKIKYFDYQEKPWWQAVRQFN